MMTKYIAIAAALLSSAAASARPLEATHHVAASRSAAAGRHAALDEIMGRVQMDALIGTIVDTNAVAPARLASDAVASGDTKLVRQHRGVVYASAASTTLRSRS